MFTSAFTADTSIMSDDGQRFLVLVRPGETIGGTSSNPLTVVLNWHARLK